MHFHSIKSYYIKYIYTNKNNLRCLADPVVIVEFVLFDFAVNDRLQVLNVN